MTEKRSSGLSPYDFRKPGRLPDDAKDLLSNWQQTLCTLAAEKWSRYLPYAVTWQSESIQTEKFGRVLEQLPDHSYVYYLRIGDAADMMFDRLDNRGTNVGNVNIGSRAAGSGGLHHRLTTGCQRGLFCLFAIQFPTKVTRKGYPQSSTINATDLHIS